MIPPKLPASIATPAYVLDVAALKRNLATAARIKRETGCKILLATKAWAMPAAFPLMRDTLDGTTASGEYEARMGREEFGKEVHVYSPAYGPGEVARLTKIAEETGGRIFLPDNFDDLGLAYQQVAEELRSQYVIFYSPTKVERDGKYRAVRVKVKRPGTHTATRFGYYAR